MPLAAARVERHPLAGLSMLPDFVIAPALALEFIARIAQYASDFARLAHLVSIDANLG